jgi:ribulose-5-phosphate 4-epimerase/fuculose-1-phosphate aldolase
MADKEATGVKSMNALSAVLHDLVVANRILAHEGVVDGYGHISVRHPERADRFFVSRSRSPELVEFDDLMEFDLDCNPIDQRDRVMYAERAIHGGVYRARPDVQSVVHNHAQEVIPFTIVKTAKLRAVLHSAGGIGTDIPVWDIRDKFGETDMLVRNAEQGQDLAACLGHRSVALMRGHGCVVAGQSIRDAVLLSIYMMVNAKLQKEAMQLGEVTYLSDAEAANAGKLQGSPLSLDRVWEYWARRCGMAA